ncbi:glycosyltransferase [Bacillus sp. PAMC26568]|nr:glycosyltransferase [Bacillus sp. PAMC26568]
MNNLISIIIPIYNVEKWLPNCIECILDQTFREIEIILVNDGSSDKSGEICDEYAKKDSRIKVIHKDNGGSSSARNLGIKVAIGKYIVFIDADDQISLDYCSKLYNIAENHNCDVVLCGYKTFPQENIIIPSFKLNTVMNGREFVLSSLNPHTKNDLCFSWRYIFKLQRIKENNISFNEQIFVGEDVLFNLECLLQSKKVYALKEVLYFYNTDNSQSLMRTPFNPKLESSLVLQYELRKTISQKFGLLDYKHYRKDMAYYYVNNIYGLLIKNLINSTNGYDEYSFMKIVNYEMFSDCLKEIGLFYNCQNYKEYLHYLAFKFKISSILKANYRKQYK